MKSPDYDDSVGRKRLEHMARGDQLKAVIFDLDGTLIHSNVPFPPYRDRLNIQGDVIAGIGKLPPELQKEKWDIIAEYESELERQAQPAPGVRPLLVYVNYHPLKGGWRHRLLMNRMNPSFFELLD